MIMFQPESGASMPLNFQRDFIDKGRLIYKSTGDMDQSEIVPGVNVIKKLSAKTQHILNTVGGASHKGDRSRQDSAVITSMLNAGVSASDCYTTFVESPRGHDAEQRKTAKYLDSYLTRTIHKAEAFMNKNGRKIADDELEEAIDGTDWRKEFKSKNQLNRNPSRHVIEKLVPEKSLTIISAPSFHGKSWLAIHLGAAISTGRGLWGFYGPKRAIPFRYHVPEMDEALVRQRMEQLHIADSEMFLVRAMESGVTLPLNDERMLASSQGAVVCLDTMGYFNEADDTANYQQSIMFGKAVFNLLTAGGALAVIALYHPTKYSSKETVLTLENSVLGSAGYGGILRSCLALRNLNADLNDQNLRLYVQGLKNPRLKPFQLEGVPLRMMVKPGESPYLSEIVGSRKNGKQYVRDSEVLKRVGNGESDRSIAESMKISPNTIRKIRKKTGGDSDDD